MSKRIEINEQSEFDKLTDLGTTYHRDGKIVVATTVGVAESADTQDVNNHRVDFIYNK